MKVTAALGRGHLAVVMNDAKLSCLRGQEAKLIKELAALGRRLTVGKLAEAIGLDFIKHQGVWKSGRLA